MFTFKLAIQIVQRLMLDKCRFGATRRVALRKFATKWLLMNVRNVNLKVLIVRCNVFAAWVRTGVAFRSVVPYLMDLDVMLVLGSVATSRKLTHIRLGSGM